LVSHRLLLSISFDVKRLSTFLSHYDRHANEHLHPRGGELATPNSVDANFSHHIVTLVCEFYPVNVVVCRGIPINGQLEVSLDSDGCLSSPYSRVVHLEHVQAVVTLAASRRGEVEVFLTSPQGTRSTLLARRIRDASTEGFNAWAFMTTHCWGEVATGTWKLEVRNGASACKLLCYYGIYSHLLLLVVVMSCCYSPLK